MTGAHRHDVTQLLPLVDRIPAVAGRVGRPRRRPDQVQGDRAYDSQAHRRALQKRIGAVLARRGQAHGSGLGVYRWVVISFGGYECAGSGEPKSMRPSSTSDVYSSVGTTSKSFVRNSK